MAGNNKDMSNVCGFGYERAWVNDTIEEYFEKYCKNCRYMSEICMYGDVEFPDDNGKEEE